MFHTDDAPIRVTATAQLVGLLERERASRPDLSVVLDDLGAKLTSSVDGEVIYLGEVAETTPCYATADSHTPWWRFRADIDCSGEDVDFNLTELSDAELAATIAAGPLPRGARVHG